MAAVLYRRLLSNMDNYSTKVSADVQELCKTQLLQAVQHEDDEQMRKKLCDCVAELAKCYLGEELISYFIFSHSYQKYFLKVRLISIQLQFSTLATFLGSISLVAIFCLWVVSVLLLYTPVYTPVFQKKWNKIDQSIFCLNICSINFA